MKYGHAIESNLCITSTACCVPTILLSATNTSWSLWLRAPFVKPSIHTLMRYSTGSTHRMKALALVDRPGRCPKRTMIDQVC